MRIFILGPAYPYRGGIAAFSQRLARELSVLGHEPSLITFTLQYPKFLFPGKTQLSSDPAPEGLDCRRMINSINPFNWLSVGRKLRKEKPDLVVVSFWLPYMAPALGTIARLCGAPVVGLVHNLIPHEHKPGDHFLARYFCKSCERFVTLSDSVMADIRKFCPDKPVRVNPHPVYDNFGAPVPMDQAREYLGLPKEGKILLSFGLIRDYKGLDWLIEAFSRLENREGVHLLVAGEFYSDGEKYHCLARRLGIDDEIIWRTEFVPDSEVKYYFSAADLVVQPYKSATQSGVTQIAYNFEKPMLVTRVGGLPEIVPDGRAGYVVEPTVEAIAEGLSGYIEKAPDFSEALSVEKKRFSWAMMAAAVINNRNI